MIDIKRKRTSVTQGSYQVIYKGNVIREYGDTIELKPKQGSSDGAVSMGGWIGRTDTEILCMMGFDHMTYEYGDNTWYKKQEEKRVLTNHRNKRVA